MSQLFQAGSATAAPARRLRFADLKLRTKVLALVGVSVVVTTTCVGVGAVSLNSEKAQLKTLVASDVAAAVQAADTRGQVAVFRRLTLQLILADSPELSAKAVTKLAETEKKVDEGVAVLTQVATGDGDASKVADAAKTWDAMRTFFHDKIEPQAKRNDLSPVQSAALASLAVDEYGTVADEAVVAFEALKTEKRKDLDAGAAEAAAVADRARTTLLVVATLGALLLVALGWWIAGAVAGPVARLKTAIDGLADGDLTVPVDVDSRDEVGQMAASLTVAQAALRESMTTIVSSSATLAGSAEELSVVSAQVAASAEETSVQSGTAAAAAEEVSRNVQTVAAATEQMSASIREISQSSTEAVRVAQAAAEEAQTATGTVSKLGDSSREIGDVVKVITSIAEQTNLLALNATIEAARAGEAGKGFAVVASEVKDLAQETARATEDISRRIEAIQTDSEAAVAAIARIAEIIEEVNSYQTTIASAVEEQTATTSEMSRNVQDAASGAGGIAGNIEYVATAAQSSSTGIVEAQRAAAELAQLSGDLRELVSRYRV
ncbi:methyl-accepting chemotaxis protein [Kineosporia sp. A_224]|uniref:methyl-accepting chemotaxis protein n=1 Tax=Kineosporia sp. A_224 TaxID=1962180 RepID=UPI000B4B616C|nr:methyl-accepting chemotaxis protein [Kineosporia sp. A_224]